MRRHPERLRPADVGTARAVVRHRRDGGRRGRMTYRKDDVTFHREHFGDGHAAVNVKSYDWPTAETVARVLADEGYILATGVDADELAGTIAEDQGAWEAAAG